MSEDTVADVLKSRVTKVDAYRSPDGRYHATVEDAVKHMVASHRDEQRSRRHLGIIMLIWLTMVVGWLFLDLLP